MKPLFRTDPQVQDRADMLVNTVAAESPHMCIDEVLETAWADAWHHRDKAPTLPRAMVWDLVQVELFERIKSHTIVAVMNHRAHTEVNRRINAHEALVNGVTA